MLKLIHFLFLLRNLIYVCSDESQSLINGLQAVNVVNDKFLSVTVDPAVFFGDISLSPITMTLAKHLSPSYMRVAGPSTPFLDFTLDNRKSASVIDDDYDSDSDADTILITPALWWSLNEWIRNLNYTPVFAINDNKRIDGNWDPKPLLPFMDVTDKMKTKCVWQLGYDCSEKTETQYKTDVTTLNQVMSSFPNGKTDWKILASDVSNCLPSDSPDLLKTYIEGLHDVDSLMWEPDYKDETEFLEGDTMYRLLLSYKPRMPIWTTSPKSRHSINFNSAINWAVQLGEVASTGFDVIFRKPRIQELLFDTPVYWVSYLHKKLMGRNVLDVKTTPLLSENFYIYAHCAKDQNSFSVRGAMTILAINNGTEEHTTLLRVGGTQLKNVEVQSYVLTSPINDSLEVYLNNEKITLAHLESPETSIKPKLRRAKAVTHLTLRLAPKSINFIVLPGARIPVCVNNEDETEKLLEEIHEAQNLEFPVNEPIEVLTRINNHKLPNSLSKLYEKLHTEIEEDDLFYKTKNYNPLVKKSDRRLNILGKIKGNVMADERYDSKLNLFKESKVKNPFRLVEKEKKIDLPNIFDKNSFKTLFEKETTERSKVDLDLTSAEIVKILSNRARNKMEKRMGAMSAMSTLPTIDEILKNIGGRFRNRRDINMDLLRLKTGGDNRKQSSYDFNLKHATIRKPGDSDEIFQDDFVSPQKNVPSNIFASFAAQEEHTEKIVPGLPLKPSIKKENLFSGAFGDSFRNGFGDGLDAFSSISLPKKDLFSLDPPDFKINLPNFFPKLPKTPITTTTEKSVGKVRNFLSYVSEDGDEDESVIQSESHENFDYNGFLSEFGDDLTLVNPNIKARSELREADAADVNHEFVFNKKDEDIDSAIEKLETFLNKKSKSKPKPKDEFDSFESELGRFRRDLSSNIQSHWRSIREGFESKTRSIKSGLKSAFDKVLTYLPTKIFSRSKSNEIFKDTGHNLTPYQVMFLKNRLAMHKQLNQMNLQRRFKDKYDSLEKLRKSRAAKDTYNIRYDQIHIPNDLIKSYKSKLSDLKESKNEEINVLYNDELKREPRFSHDINSIDDSIDESIDGSTDESIDNFIDNSIDGNKKGDYEIDVPNIGKILLSKKGDDGKIKIHKDVKSVESSTCLASDFMDMEENKTESSTEVINETEGSTEVINETEGSTEFLNETVDNTISTKIIKPNSSDLVIEVHNNGEQHEFLFLDKIFQSVSELLEHIQKKIAQMLL